MRLPDSIDVPARIVRDFPQGLGWMEAVALALLWLRTDPTTGRCTCSYARLASDMGVSPSSAKNYIGRLAAWALLEEKQARGHIQILDRGMAYLYPKD